MRKLAALLLLALPFPTHAQSAQPYKLIVTRGANGIAITDYPSGNRCEAARQAIQRLMTKENTGKDPQFLPGGGVIISEQLLLGAYCIPG